MSDLYGNINSDLKTLSDWFKANKLSLNISKTNYMIISKHIGKIDQDNNELFIDEQKLSPSNDVKFLGLYIDNKLTWSANIRHCKAKLSSSLYAINSAIYI